MDYGREESMNLRGTIIQLRDTALTNGCMEWAVVLSHVIAWMAVVIDEKWPQEQKSEAET